MQAAARYSRKSTLIVPIMDSAVYMLLSCSVAFGMSSVPLFLAARAPVSKALVDPMEDIKEALYIPVQLCCTAQ